jgi:hypothetical protein
MTLRLTGQFSAKDHYFALFGTTGWNQQEQANKN